MGPSTVRPLHPAGSFVGSSLAAAKAGPLAFSGFGSAPT